MRLALLVTCGGATAHAADATERDVSGSVRLHLTGAAVRALSGYQASELSWGGAVYGAVEWGPTSPKWGLQLEVGQLGLSSGDGAPPVGVAPLDGARGLQLGAGLRLRPFEGERSGASAAGLWLSAAGGISLTGGAVFPQLDAFVGYDVFVSDAFALGPTLGYVHVFDTESGPRSDDASLGLLGLHATFDFAPPVSARSAPTLDADGDGVLGEMDRCPLDAEDRDGFADEDGCPDLDNDRDTIVDLRDRCPDEPEDRDGYEDADGCPELDNDQDGVPDATDRCPLEMEDRDGHQDQDGCPDLDNDADKIPDARDLCPDEPETINGFSDSDGCPDEEHVRVIGDKIELDQKIHFWSDSSVIRGVSHPVLDKLAQFLREHPEYVHVDIEGHADERGPEGLNQRLSAARAEAVKTYLAKKGVAGPRLGSAGFGSTRPLKAGNSEHDWFMNRRVEFIVTRNVEVREEKRP